MSESEKPPVDQINSETTNEAVWNVVRVLKARKDGSAERISDGAMFHADAVTAWNDGWQLLRDIRSAVESGLSEEVLQSLTEKISAYHSRLNTVRHTMLNVIKDNNSGQLSAILANKISPFLPTLQEWEKKKINTEQAIEDLTEDVEGMKKTLSGLL